MTLLERIKFEFQSWRLQRLRAAWRRKHYVSDRRAGFYSPPPYIDARQRGFTLIELLVSVGILAILAAIAVPQYLQYATKAKVAQALNLTNGVTSAANAAYQQAGVWPNTNADAQLSAPVAGKYGETVGMDGAGNIVITYGTTSPTPPALQGGLIYMSAWAGADGTVNWFCGNLAGAPTINGQVATSLSGTTDGKVTTVPIQYLPKNCAGGI